LRVALFEDERVSQLYPLTLNRPVFGLRCGPRLLYEKVLSAYPEAQLVLFLRKNVADSFLQRMEWRDRVLAVNDLDALRGDDLLLVNGRWLYQQERLAELDGEGVAVYNGTVLFARLSGRSVELGLRRTETLTGLLEWARQEVGEVALKEACVVEWPWDLVELNPGEIVAEYREFKRQLTGEIDIKDVAVTGDRELVAIAPDARLYPHVVIDVREGPVIIDNGAIVHPFTVIYGPAYIGPGTWLMGGKIRSGTTIGPNCRVGGEVEATIIHGYTNKYHDGFIGHSYLGEWINLGALTTNSDLKNDYSSVEVYINGKLIDSGSLKVGSFIGDHTKTGIGTLLNTGTTIGVMCNLVGTGEPLPKYIPSFTWYVKGKMTKGFGLKALLETARKAMARRGIEFTPAEEEMYRGLYEATRAERERLIRISRSRGG
jgi:UDP-N-acetylglucosamine diphosphorylase/glucosamine-1-phosphate N-acetyltransferase